MAWQRLLNDSMNESMNDSKIRFTEKQEEVIQNTKDNLLVISGPGTGKTAVISGKVMHLLGSGVSAKKILITTYNQQAMRQLKSRILKQLKGVHEVYHLDIYTIHGFCRRVIREFEYLIKKECTFKLIDEVEKNLFILSRYREFGIEEGRFYGLDNLHRHIFNLFSLYDFLNERCIFSGSKRLKGWIGDGRKYTFSRSRFLNDGEVGGIWKEYRRIFFDYRICDYSQSLVFAYNLLLREEVKEEMSGRYEYIFVDEYQDTSLLQHRIFQSLMGEETKICVFGDDDQSIYQFRGANLGNLRNFERDFGGVKTFTIGDNFRSTGEIVSFARRVIGGGSYFQKDFRSMRGIGEKVFYMESASHEKNAELMVDMINELYAKGVVRSYSEIAILCQSVRWGFIGKGYVDIFKREGVPILLHQSGDFFEQGEIEEVMDFFNRNGGIEEDGGGSGVLSVFYEFLRASSFLEEGLRGGGEKLKQLGYFSHIAKSYDEWGRGGVLGFMEYLEFLKKKKRTERVIVEGEDGVNVSTIHHVKGLEYRVVFLCNVIPYLNSSGQEFEVPEGWMGEDRGVGLDGGSDSQEKLFYVGLSRAKDYLILTHVKDWRQDERSKFLFKEKQRGILQGYEKGKTRFEVLDIGEGSGKAEEIQSFHYTGIRAYQSCGVRYELEHEYGFRTERNRGGEEGDIVHQVLEKMNMAKKKGWECGESDLEIFFKEGLKRLGFRGSKEWIDEDKERVFGMILGYFKSSFYEGLGRRVRIREVEKEFEVYMDHEYILTGRIDLVLEDEEGWVEIVDFKTGGKEEGWDFQLWLYGLSYELEDLKDLKGKVRWVSRYHLREGEVMRLEKKGYEYEKVKEELDGVVAKIMDREYFPNLASCGKCPFLDVCPFSSV